MPTAGCAATSTVENIQACLTVAFAAGAASWGHLTSSFGEWAPVVLWALSACVAITHIMRNIMAMRRGRP